jgi:hypothetical protein
MPPLDTPTHSTSCSSFWCLSSCALFFYSLPSLFFLAFLTRAREAAHALQPANRYTYIWIDDCWMLRDRTDKGMEADPTRFPHGIAWLADQIHGMGE